MPKGVHADSEMLLYLSVPERLLGQPNERMIDPVPVQTLTLPAFHTVNFYYCICEPQEIRYIHEVRMHQALLDILSPSPIAVSPL